MPTYSIDKNGFFEPKAGEPGFPIDIDVDYKHAALSQEDFDKLPVYDFLLPDVIPTLTWKSEVKDDDGKPKWMIGRYEPVYDADGVSRSCRVVFRGALITANGPRRQTNESRRLWDEDERYYGYWT